MPTGMATIDEINNALSILNAGTPAEIIILHFNTDIQRKILM